MENIEILKEKHKHTHKHTQINAHQRARRSPHAHDPHSKCSNFIYTIGINIIRYLKMREKLYS